MQAKPRIREIAELTARDGADIEANSVECLRFQGPGDEVEVHCLRHFSSSLDPAALALYEDAPPGRAVRRVRISLECDNCFGRCRVELGTRNRAEVESLVEDGKVDWQDDRQRPTGDTDAANGDLLELGDACIPRHDLEARLLRCSVVHLGKIIAAGTSSLGRKVLSDQRRTSPVTIGITPARLAGL